MNTTTASDPMSTTTSPAPSTATQLRLIEDLSTSARPARFHLSRTTRERGLRHAADIRRRIAARQLSATADPASADVPPTNRNRINEAA